MALIDRADLAAALGRMGRLASTDGTSLDLIVVGGGVMVPEFGTRASTRDLDVAASIGAESSADMRRRLRPNGVGRPTG